MKISAKTKDCRLEVKVKAGALETIDEKEMDRFARVFLRCFLKPKQIKKSAVEFTGPFGISLRDRLKKEIGKRDFLFILEHIVVAVQKLHANRFSVCHLQMDLQHIFINDQTKELQFIYVPMIGQETSGSVVDLFKAVVHNANPAQEQDMYYAYRLFQCIDAMNPFDINKIEQFVMREDMSVVNTVRKQNSGQSGYMTSKHKSYYDHMEAQETLRTQNPADDEATGILEEQDEPTGLLQEPDEPTGILEEFQEYGINPAEIEIWQENKTQIIPEEESVGNDYTQEETCLLEDAQGEETALLVNPSPARVIIPELVRTLTGERIRINKPVFRLGKERSFVDYFVANNNAVSRSHADIITRGNAWFLVDLNSKNGTYINGQSIGAHVETQLRDGDRVCLGNENFVFTTGSRSNSDVCPMCQTAIRPGAIYCSHCGVRL